MKIGVAGAGHWGKNLVRNFHDLGVLSGVAEPHEALREKIAGDFPEQAVYSSLTDLLATEPDAVAVATPAPTHFKVAQEILLAGKDVFIEKPMTLTVEDAEDLVRLARERERILMVGHLLLYQPAIQWIKKFLSEGGLGEIYSLHQERMKLGRARYIENVTWSLGVHDLAVLLYLVGEEPVSVFASGHCGLSKDVEDDVYVHLQFPSGAKAHLHNSWLWPENRRALTIIGSEGMLVYNEIEQTVVLHNKTIDQNLENQDLGEKVVFEGAEAPLRLELEHFLTCLKTREAPISDGRNGLDVVRVLRRITY